MKPVQFYSARFALFFTITHWKRTKKLHVGKNILKIETLKQTSISTITHIEGFQALRVAAEPVVLVVGVVLIVVVVVIFVAGGGGVVGD